MSTTHDALRGLTIGEPSAVRNLTVFPLLQPGGGVPAYRLLAEALVAETVKISEVSQAGTVPVVSLLNSDDMPVLLLDGEHLVGCKQNRIVNTSILVPARAETALPVSCVEHGRWRQESSHFAHSGHVMFAELRAEKVAQVSHSLRLDASYASDQSAIWSGIADKAGRMGSDSESGAMSGIYRRREAEIADYLRQIEPLPGQRGAIFAINGRVAGLELVDAESTWRKCLSNVAAGYALDAIDRDTDLVARSLGEAPQAFLQRLERAQEESFPGVGLGEDVRLEGDNLAGLALTLGGSVIHLCAFDLSGLHRGRLATRRWLAGPSGSHGNA